MPLPALVFIKGTLLELLLDVVLQKLHFIDDEDNSISLSVRPNGDGSTQRGEPRKTVQRLLTIRIGRILGDLA